MRIAVIAPLLIEVPPKDFGFGAQEYIIHELTEGLVERGHEVTLFASGDSQTKASLVSVIPQALLNRGEMKPFEKETLEMVELSEAAIKSRDFDVINNHILPYGLFFSRLFNAPVIHTLHHEIHKDKPDADLYRKFKDSSLVSISDAQREVMPELNYASTIYNAVDTSYYSFKEKPEEDYFLHIGRMKRYKGMHIAIDICRKFGLKLKIVSPMPMKGQNDYEEVISYWKEIEPQIGGDIEYLGEVSGKEKLKLLSNAKAMIFPVTREEPFGMTIIEAMSCGTPVIALKKGAVPEIMGGLEEFMVDSEEELGKAVLKLNQMDEGSYLSLRKKVRELVESKFNKERMIGDYEDLFKKVVNSSKL